MESKGLGLGEGERGGEGHKLTFVFPSIAIVRSHGVKAYILVRYEVCVDFHLLFLGQGKEALSLREGLFCIFFIDTLYSFPVNTPSQKKQSLI